MASATPPLAVEGTSEEEHAAVSAQPHAQRTLHGFRLGYMFVNDFDRRLNPDDPESSLAGRVDMKSPHLFLLGYEVTRRLIGHSWLNIILVGNVMVGGLEQSKFYPSANALIGFEFDESFQIGVGPNLTPDPDKVAHILFAGGWTPTVGSFPRAGPRLLYPRRGRHLADRHDPRSELVALVASCGELTRRGADAHPIPL